VSGVTDNPEVRGRVRAKAKDREALRLACWRDVLHAKSGRFVMRDLLDAFCAVTRQPFVHGGQEGDRATAVRCGQLGVGLELQRFFAEHFPEELALLRSEEDAERLEAQRTRPATKTEETSDA
jgi:hypothetical protein